MMNFIKKTIETANNAREAFAEKHLWLSAYVTGALWSVLYYTAYFGGVVIGVGLYSLWCKFTNKETEEEVEEE